MQFAAYAGTCRFRKVRARLMVRAFNSGGSFQGNTVISAFGASEATACILQFLLRYIVPTCVAILALFPLWK